MILQPQKLANMECLWKNIKLDIYAVILEDTLKFKDIIVYPYIWAKQSTLLNVSINVEWIQYKIYFLDVLNGFAVDWPVITGLFTRIIQISFQLRISAITEFRGYALVTLQTGEHIQWWSWTVPFGRCWV